MIFYTTFERGSSNSSGFLSSFWISIRRQSVCFPFIESTRCSIEFVTFSNELKRNGGWQYCFGDLCLLSGDTECLPKITLLFLNEKRQFHRWRNFFINILKRLGFSCVDLSRWFRVGDLEEGEFYCFFVVFGSHKSILSPSFSSLCRQLPAM